jgi:hypothetical protein
MELMLVAVIFGSLCCVEAFTNIKSTNFGQHIVNSGVYGSRRGINSNALNMALASSASLLVKKGKMKEVQILQANMTAVGESHPVNQFLKDGTRPFGVGKPVDFFNSTASRFQSISVLPEFSKKAKTGFVLDLPPPEILGGVLRDAGSRGTLLLHLQVLSAIRPLYLFLVE